MEDFEVSSLYELSGRRKDAKANGALAAVLENAQSPIHIDSNRCIQYFVVGSPGELETDLSVLSTSDSPIDLTFRAEVTFRYPRDDTAGFALPEGLSTFLYPYGMKLKLTGCLPKLLDVVLTDGTGACSYVTCFSFWERVSLDELRHQIERSIAKKKDFGGEKNVLPKWLLNHSSRFSFVFLPGCLCFVSRYPFFSEFRLALREIYRIGCQREEVVPLERYISSLVLGIPVPPHGIAQFCVTLGTLNLTFRLPPQNELPFTGVSFRPLFLLLSPESIITLFACILSERKIAMYSSYPAMLVQVLEALCSLIFPLKWESTYIPVLPEKLIDVLFAPVPFIVGMHRSMMDNHTMLSDVVYVDLDFDRILINKDEIPAQLSDHDRTKLISRIYECGDIYQKVPDFPVFSDRPFFTADEVDLEQLETSQQIDFRSVLLDEANPKLFSASQIRLIFLHYMMKLIIGWKRYITIELDENLTSEHEPFVFFDERNFLNVELNSKRQHRERFPLLHEITGTQMWQAFIHKHSLKLEDIDVKLFRELSKAYSKGSRWRERIDISSQMKKTLKFKKLSHARFHERRSVRFSSSEENYNFHKNKTGRRRQTTTVDGKDETWFVLRIVNEIFNRAILIAFEHDYQRCSQISRGLASMNQKWNYAYSTSEEDAREAYIQSLREQQHLLQMARRRQAASVTNLDVLSSRSASRAARSQLLRKSHITWKSKSKKSKKLSIDTGKRFVWNRGKKKLIVARALSPAVAAAAASSATSPKRRFREKSSSPLQLQRKKSFDEATAIAAAAKINRRAGLNRRLRLQQLLEQRKKTMRK
eukprot:g280.t1